MGAKSTRGRQASGDPSNASYGPSPLAIIRDHQQAIATIGGTVQHEDQRYTILKASKDGKEIWAQVDEARQRGYLLTIVEKQSMAQGVVASASLELNTKLSQARPEAVVQTLVGKHGIAASRLIGRGVGPLAPLASNDSEDGRARNRRVKLVKQ